MRRGWKILIAVVLALAVLLGLNALVTSRERSRRAGHRRPPKRLAEYRAIVPGVETKLIAGSGHSPNVEKPARTAALVLAFAAEGERAKKPAPGHEMQKRLQNRDAVRKRP